MSGASFALIFSALVPAQAVIATDPVGYITTTASGGTPSNPGLTFVSPTLANPVEWQGRLTAVNGTVLTVANADWESGAWDSRYCLEVTSGTHAGIWTEIVSAAGNQLTVADPMQSLLTGDETVRIRRFTTLSDFLGAENEAGLGSAAAMAHADVVTVYHASGAKNYWYYDGSMGVGAGWVDSSWNAAGDVIIAPGEGVILRRKGTDAITVSQVGTVKTGAQGIIVAAKRNFVGGVTPVDLKLGESQLYTGSAIDGVAGGPVLARSDSVVVYGTNGLSSTYWYYDGSMGGLAGWMDSSWRSADNVVIPGGSTFVVDRKQGTEAFLWFLPSLIN